MTPILVEGRGLHTGEPARLGVEREAGPVRLRAGGITAPLEVLLYDGLTRSTTARTAEGRLVARTTEHLFGALAALGIREGLVLTLEGPELPLADGGAAVFFDALASLATRPGPPALLVARSGAIVVEDSRYTFEPGEGVGIEVEVDFGVAYLDREASWAGDADDFRARIAPARTFALERDVEELARRGLARHVAPESAVVLGAERAWSAGAPFSPDEPARHKLLDLLGDLYCYGGPPRGRVRATRPGHRATHDVVRRALDEGILARTPRSDT